MTVLCLLYGVSATMDGTHCPCLQSGRASRTWADNKLIVVVVRHFALNAAWGVVAVSEIIMYKMIFAHAKRIHLSQSSDLFIRCTKMRDHTCFNQIQLALLRSYKDET